MKWFILLARLVRHAPRLVVGLVAVTLLLILVWAQAGHVARRAAEMEVLRQTQIAQDAARKQAEALRDEYRRIDQADDAGGDAALFDSLRDGAFFIGPAATAAED